MSTFTTPHESLPVSRMTAEHWARLHAMSEQQILQNALDDVDNPPWHSDTASGRMETMTVTIDIDADYAKWLHEHHLDSSKIASALLSQFVAAQSGTLHAKK